jgi:hypothetical protein
MKIVKIPNDEHILNTRLKCDIESSTFFRIEGSILYLRLGKKDLVRLKNANIGIVNTKAKMLISGSCDSDVPAVLINRKTMMPVIGFEWKLYLMNIACFIVKEIIIEANKKGTTFLIESNNILVQNAFIWKLLVGSHRIEWIRFIC